MKIFQCKTCGSTPLVTSNPSYVDEPRNIRCINCHYSLDGCRTRELVEKWTQMYGAEVPDPLDIHLMQNMSLLDYFAGQALISGDSISSCNPISPQQLYAARASAAYEQAEAMLAERGKRMK